METAATQETITEVGAYRLLSAGCDLTILECSDPDHSPFNGDPGDSVGICGCL